MKKSFVDRSCLRLHVSVVHVPSTPAPTPCGGHLSRRERLLSELRSATDRDNFILANADGNTSSRSSSGSSSSSSGTQPHQWVADVQGIGDVLVNLYEKIVNPILYGGGKYTGSFNIEAKQESNTMQYLIVGGVIIVALVLLLKYTKK